ncbi:MAG TPA: Glu/Leu/Phe/Val dehydrogenase dimerization domain-containing protein [Gemmatimonadota bacterium]|nr:Glu/Leu/Phe/Val dehydrogenase dimerization domain-containing protein [Gemmatimonadota bacterium]
MTVFGAPEYAGHELVLHGSDPAVGLRAIIAIHDTSLGPAVGGCRMWPYESDEAALRDVLRLSRAMTYKCALAGLPFGGGKSVILGDPRADKSDSLLERFGRLVDLLGGIYRVGEDVGIGSADVEVMARATRHVAGIRQGEHASGDPSPFTARGVLVGMRIAVHHQLGRRDLKGLRIAVQGVGSVGAELCRLLHTEGATLVVADRDPQRARYATESWGAETVPPEAIWEAPVDVFAPCALGAVLDDRTIPRLRASVVAGAANDQLAENRHGDELRRRQILYAPDYVINAGGVINGSGEILGHYDPAEAWRRVERIGPRLEEILRLSDLEGVAPNRVADAMAEKILAAAR